ncbi:MAG: DUF4136 domain-containing protein [Acidobacteriaceae bacterium]|nr:DUF4136 domain-containing protein [Acidobacteriaceae bacterium]
MKKTSRSWTAVFSPALLLTLIACPVVHGQEVRTNYLPGTDFSNYRTYSWVTIPGAGVPNQILDTEIKESIDSQLRARGFTKVDSGTPDPPQTTDFPQPPGLPQLPAGLQQPPDLPRTADSASKGNSANKADLVIDYQVAINHERQWNAYGMGDGFPWAGMRTATATATSSTIEVGTLVLDMYDPATKRLVWTGSATKTINLSKDQQKNQKNLDKAMQKLLKDFPPRGR